MAYISFQPHDYFNTLLYTGNGSAGNAQTGVGFQPDWVWYKARSTTANHGLFDAVRGTSKQLYSDTTATEATYSGVTSFDSDGFTLGTDAGGNGNGVTYVAWNWRAGNSAGSSNTDGTLNSTVSVNTTAGFSVVTYTGNGSAGATVGHGLGAVPKMIIEKGRSVTDDWLIYHQQIGNTHGLALNNTTAATDSDTYFNDTSPTSTVFTLGNNGKVNTNNGTHVAYCFAEKKGFSKFGSYTGNGNADGSFIYTGFKPAFILHKRTDNTSGWDLFDNKRLGYNVANRLLAPNSSDQEATSDKIDILSNGFKMRTTTGGNYSGATYIYMAFAEEPLVSSNNIPATAR